MYFSSESLLLAKNFRSSVSLCLVTSVGKKSLLSGLLFLHPSQASTSGQKAGFCITFASILYQFPPNHFKVFLVVVLRVLNPLVNANRYFYIFSIRNIGGAIMKPMLPVLRLISEVGRYLSSV